MTYLEILKTNNLPDSSNIFVSSSIASKLSIEDDLAIKLTEHQTLRPSVSKSPTSFKIHISDRPAHLSPVRHTFVNSRQPNFELTVQNTKLGSEVIAVSLDKITTTHINNTMKKYPAELFTSRLDRLSPIDFITVNTPYSVTTAKEAIRLSYDLKEFEEPTSIISKAIDSNTFIFFYVDSDADGVLSGAVCDDAMKTIGYSNYTVISNDRKYGNGVNEHTITLLTQALLEKNLSIDDNILMITADHGSSNVIPIKNMKDTFPNLKIGITDHHNFNERNQPDTVFHLNNQASYSMMPKSYSGCVVVGLLMINLIIERSILKSEFFIPLALSMVSDRRDMLCGYGRALVSFVEQGLFDKTIERTTPFKSIEYQSNSWGWNLIPLINSCGRQSASNKALQFLTTTLEDYQTNYKQISKRNNRRKLVTKTLKKYIVNDLINTPEFKAMSYERMAYYIVPYDIVLSSGFHIDEVNGIVGVLASQLDTLAYKPTIVFAQQPDGSYKGSGRKNVHGNFSFRPILKELVSANLLKGGGHDGAAGITIPNPDNLNTVLLKLDEYAINADKDGYTKQSSFDITVDVKLLNKPFLKFLEHFGPYGTNWSEPKVKVRTDVQRIDVDRKPYLRDVKLFDSNNSIVFRTWGNLPINYKPTYIGSVTWDKQLNCVMVTER